MVESRITVPAFLIKEDALSQILLSTLPAVGIWYCGSSITNGDGSPANILVFFNMIPEHTIAATPMKYALVATQAEALPSAFGKNAPAIIAMIGSFAPQGMNVVVMIDILRSRSDSMVLVAITPGIPQPELINIGINALPERPNLRKIRSMINATRAMYPQSSRIARKKNSTIICGTKPSTAPTPATIPSRINPCNQSAQPTAFKKPSTAGGTISPNNTSLVQSVTIVPTVVTEM